MKQLQQLQDALVSLRLSEASKELPALLAKAEKEQVSYLSFLQTLVDHEREKRDEKNMEKRLKLASFPCITPLVITATQMYHLCHCFYQRVTRNLPLIDNLITT
ncbi:ATP-binding protein [Mesobacillus subterraneus]|uniref:ATP-binding protein n=1 Tax=Mesobacillus subterraneus TaxID=285983 RepID=UPI00273EAB1C|nr:ATP-binding protein [Mesobacillus subterraneus]WLR56725.1 ATP-binding protein [Mesobacillus subterraneus]